MQLPKGAIVAVADGERFNLFRNAGDAADLRLAALPQAEVDAHNKGSGGNHGSSAANPDGGQLAEDGFAAGVAALLNREALAGRVTALVVVAAPRTLGELRKHYHKALVAVLEGEIAKDLTGHALPEVQKAIIAA